MERRDCPFETVDGSGCWIDQILRGASAADVMLTGDQVNRCIHCEYFDEAIKRSMGRRSSDRLISTAIGRFLGVLSDSNEQLARMAEDLRKKIEELTVLKTVSEALLGASNLSDCLKVFLTGVTAGDAIGFNRAAVFLVNQPRRVLEGQLGFGYIELEKYSSAWEQISKTMLTFPELIQNVLSEDGMPGNDLTEVVRKTYIPLRAEFGLLPAAVLERRSFRVSCLSEEHMRDRQMLKIFGGRPCAVVPIISEETALGAVIVDNPVTASEISVEDVSMLETLCYLAASKIDNLILQSQLEIRVVELEHLHRLIQDNQKYLLETERLVEAGKLATAIAHEVKTPLVTIGGYARRAQRSHEKGEDITHDLGVMIEEISRLEEITRDVLDYSGRRELNLKDVSLNSIIDETLEIVGGKLSLGNLEAETVLCDGDLVVRADKNRLKQVLYNLIDNAVQAMPDGGKLTIKSGFESGYCWFSVADTGSGMSTDTKANVFEPFFTTKDGGVGLGLPVSKRIVADHGGYVEVSSTPGEGSSFRVYLPSKEAE
jgi:signal transduction histidine kinase